MVSVSKEVKKETEVQESETTHEEAMAYETRTRRRSRQMVYAEEKTRLKTRLEQEEVFPNIMPIAHAKLHSIPL